MSAQTTAPRSARSWQRRIVVLALFLFIAGAGWSAAWLMDRRQILQRRLDIESLGGGDSRVKVDQGTLPWWSWIADKRYFEKVTEVNLTSTRHLDFRKLTCFKDLESLILFDATVSDDDLAQVATLPRLRSLNLYRTNLKGPEYKHLADLPSLEELRIGPVSDSAVNYLQGCNSLRELRISRSQRFTDEGLQRLPQILPSLTAIYLYNTGTTEAGQRAMEKQYPNLRIHTQGGE